LILWSLSVFSKPGFSLKSKRHTVCIAPKDAVRRIRGGAGSLSRDSGRLRGGARGGIGHEGPELGTREKLLSGDEGRSQRGLEQAARGGHGARHERFGRVGLVAEI